MALVTPQLIEGISSQVKADFRRLDTKFTGEFTVSLHIQAGKVGHIRLAEKQDKEPRVPETSRHTERPGQTEDELINFIHIQLNRVLSPDYYGILTVTLHLASGHFEMITCGSERTYQFSKPRVSAR